MGSDLNPYREEPARQPGSEPAAEHPGSGAPEGAPDRAPSSERSSSAGQVAPPESSPHDLSGGSNQGGSRHAPRTSGPQRDIAAEAAAAAASILPPLDPASPPEVPNGIGGRTLDGGYRQPGGGRDFQQGRNGRRHRRGRGRGPRRDAQPAQVPFSVTATTEARGWFDPARDGGFIRRAANSYLAESGDAFVAPALIRQYGLRKADLIDATVGIDPRGRPTVAEIRSINDRDPASMSGRPEFNSLTASYPERKLYMETGRTSKGGPEITRRAIDLIAPIGYGQRALIVAPARAGKTTLLHSLTEGIAINHPNAVLLILLVDERPEEVSEAISWGVGEVVSSSFDQPAQRHVEVTDIVLERARRLVETGRDVVIVLDSLTRMARAHNTAERGSGRTLSGGLDATAMARPKAFFGSARNIPASSGGGSLTIISTALVETGSRMDDVIFEEFKGTGNSEIKLDRGLAEKRIYPAIDIGTSGTRREEKLFRPDQLDAVYTLRRGLSQMPSQ